MIDDVYFRVDLAAQIVDITSIKVNKTLPDISLQEANRDVTKIADYIKQELTDL